MNFQLDTIVARAKRRAFAYPWSEIYWWLANAWDLGPYWVEIKNNIEKNRRKYFVQKRNDIIWLDSQILMNPKVWEASGHVWWFSDPLIDCKKCKSRLRADQLIEEYINKNKLTIKEIIKHIDWEWNIENNNVWSRTFDQQFQFIKKFKIKCPKCWACDWTEPKQFNLMFKTEQWIVEGEGTAIYLRPETAQGIFVNFKNILDTTRSRIPFGIAQIWKSFRNEITPGNFMFRVREFYQMEIEYFVENDEKIWIKYFETWKEISKDRWINQIWINEKKLKFRDHEKDELSFYSKWTCDVEYEFPRWRWELQWIAYRTDYDLKQHMKFSWKDLQYSDPQTGKRYVPHVIEPSWGLTRAILTTMIDAYDEEKYKDWAGNEQTRVVARFHKNIAPIKFAVIPLVKKDEKMVAMAKEIFDKLSEDFMCEFDDSWNIGKCYRRQDEIWTPYCITIDNQSLEDWTVTIRDRDTMQQKRIKSETISL
jgi:glycyl-tRNA synthetase